MSCLLAIPKHPQSASPDRKGVVVVGVDNAFVPETVDSSTDVAQVPVVPIEVKSTLTLTLEDATGFDKDGDAFKDTLKESIAEVLGSGVSVSDVEITTTSINSTTGPAEVVVQVTIKNVETAEEAQRLADLLDASVINGALNDALEENAPNNGLDGALVPEPVDSRTDVAQVPVVPIQVKSTLTLTLEDALGSLAPESLQVRQVILMPDAGLPPDS